MNNTKQERRNYRISHSAASIAVRTFNHGTKGIANPFTMDDSGEFAYQSDEDKTTNLVFPLEKDQLGHYISASFTEVKGHTEMIRIRAFNWRCEDEPNGLYAKADARRFYAQLISGGFIPSTK